VKRLPEQEMVTQGVIADEPAAADEPAGDPCVADEDFAAWVRSVSDSLHRTAYLLTGSRDSAQDLVQTALIKIYSAWPRRHDWDNRDAYARRVLVNTALSARRRRWAGERATADLPEPRAAGRPDEIAAVADRDRLRRALLRLPLRQRTAVVLRHDSQPSGTLTADGPAMPAPSTSLPGPAHRSQANLPPRSAWRGSPTSCPTDVSTPSMPYGKYCGPQPIAGNGLGPDGVCTGAETAPPCGPGAVAGQYYAYTLPGYDPAPGCDGLIYFDGRRWLSELPPPDTDSPAAPQYVWMALQADGRLGFISPNGAVGFDPATPATQPDC